MRISGIAYIAPAVIAWELLVVLGCYLLTRSYGSFRDSYPFISDLGNAAPQIYLFAIGLATSATARAVLMYCRYVQLQSMFLTPPYRCLFGWNTVILVSGWLACVFQCLIGWTSDVDYKMAHGIFAAACFALSIAYQLMHTALIWWTVNHDDSEDDPSGDRFSKLCPRPTRNRFAWYWLWNIVAVITGAMVTFWGAGIDVGQASIAESVLIGSMSVYTLPYYYELAPASLRKLARAARAIE